MKNILKFSVFILIFFVLSTSIISAKNSKTIAMVLPVTKDMFFGPVVEFAQAASDDLNIKLKIYDTNNSHIRMVSVVEEIARKRKKVDGLIFLNFKKVGKQILDILERARIPSFNILDGFQKDEGVGIPRERYRYWVGEMLPDDVGAGYTLANLIINRAKKASDGKVHLLAFEGLTTSGASNARVKGLKKAINERNDVILKQVLSASWDAYIAKNKFTWLKRGRYKSLTAVWAANDAMAKGVVDGTKELKLRIGKDIVTGGVDWSHGGLNIVESGGMVASIGGQIMVGGWAVVLLHDYLHGIDFRSEGTQFPSEMSALTSKNIRAYRSKLPQDQWHKIDFRKFSKKYNRGKKYRFNLEALLEQF